MKLVRVLLALLIGFAAAPALADQWYEHYARAEKALLEADHATAIAELNQALERRGNSGLRVRTYGMRVIDYFPYLRLGIAYYTAGEYEAALRAFDTEEQLGAIQGSESALGELTRFRDRASQALERQQREQQEAVDALVAENVAEARDQQRSGRLDEALAAANRALALAPADADAAGLAQTLRDEIARRDEEQTRTRRADQLIDVGRRLQAQGRLDEAAARFRQAAELAPESVAGGLLAAVQVELADAAPGLDAAVSLAEVEGLAARGDLDAALGLLQRVLAVEPDNPTAAELEVRLLDAIADRARSAEITRLMGEARSQLDSGNLEAALASANLVLARDRGNEGALELIRQAYTALGRRLLGDGSRQNLPPAIRFAGSGREGASALVVTEPSFRLTGVVIDESEVEFSARTGTDEPVAAEVTSQPLSGVVITEFSLARELVAGPTTIAVVATDIEGLSSRSEVVVEYRRPLLRLPWLWVTLPALALLVLAGRWMRRSRRRARLRRRRYNPFVAGPPVLDPRLFVGRDALVDRILATVPNNSLLLLGERRIGKTSTLQQLRLRLPELDHPRFCFVPVSIDLQGVAEGAFFATVAEAVGETIGDSRMAAAGSEGGYDSRELVRDLRRVLPTVECPDGRRAKLVLLLDEIDELNGYSYRTNQRLRGLFMRSFADRLVAVAAGVGISREWEHEGSPWYNFFEEIEVGPVDAASARQLVTEPLQGVLEIDGAAIDRMLEQARGRPYVLQKLALAAVQRAHEAGRRRITLEDVEELV